MHALPDTPARAGPSSPVAWWSRALGRLPNQKFAATEEIYGRSRLGPRSDVERLAAANVEFTYRYYARLERLRYATTRRRLHATVDDSAARDLHDALELGRGAVLVSAHYGDFDVAGSWIAQVLGHEVVVISRALPEAARQRWFEDVRRKSGVLLRRSDETRLSDVEGDLRRGRVVLFMIDRLIPGPAFDGTLLGQPTKLPIAPCVLTRRTGAPLICGTTTTESDGRRRLIAERPAPLDGDRREPASVLVAAADILTSHIRRCPWQWHIPADVRELPFAASAPVPLPDLAIAAERDVA